MTHCVLQARHIGIVSNTLRSMFDVCQGVWGLQEGICM